MLSYAGVEEGKIQYIQTIYKKVANEQRTSCLAWSKSITAPFPSFRNYVSQPSQHSWTMLSSAAAMMPCTRLTVATSRPSRTQIGGALSRLWRSLCRKTAHPHPRSQLFFFFYFARSQRSPTESVSRNPARDRFFSPWPAQPRASRSLVCVIYQLIHSFISSSLLKAWTSFLPDVKYYQLGISSKSPFVRKERNVRSLPSRELLHLARSVWVSGWI